MLAARTTCGNVRVNGLEDRILAICGKGEDFISSPADLVMANIHYDVMEKIVSSDGFAAKKWFILSGMMRTDARRIADTLARRSSRIMESWTEDGIWHTFLGKN